LIGDFTVLFVKPEGRQADVHSEQVVF